MAREYKDSGIEWIGQIPKEWIQYRIKYNTFLKGRIGWQGLNSSDFLDEGYCLITGTDFDNKGGVNWNSCYRISEERFNEDELLHVKKGDLLMTKDGTVGKMAFIKELPEEASLNSHLLIIRQLTKLIDNYFLYWMMLSDVFKGFISYYQSGTIMSSISQSTLGFFACYCPPLPEQQKIANHLDKVCGEVDEMVALQETMIEELKAYKQSVITEAVTKGLNPNVPMRDSGIDWIGEIPEHWEVQPFKWILRRPLQYGANESGLLYDETLPRYVRITDIFNNCLREDLQKQSLTEEQSDGYILEDNDILFARSGGTVGKAFIYKKEYGRCAFAGYLIRAQINSNCCPNYVYYYTQSQSYEEWKRQIFIQATIQNIGADRYSLMELPVPPIYEQRAIASYLDTKCSEIDSLIALKQAKIGELKEYKKSVIYEYVTGKKEVC